jgi:protein-arginine kinase activator protein McsA
MARIVRLTENEINRLVKKVIKETHTGARLFKDKKDNFFSSARKLSMLMNDYDDYLKKGNYKEAALIVDSIRMMIKRMEDDFDEVKKVMR